MLPINRKCPGLIMVHQKDISVLMNGLFSFDLVACSVFYGRDRSTLLTTGQGSFATFDHSLIYNPKELTPLKGTVCTSQW